MSDLGRQDRNRREEQPDPHAQGPSLTLLYSLIALALLAAIACATLIVLPFYRHRQ